jgi:polynucleotide 5'-hydroxyl-kinase GRC3/NOL9
VGSDRTDQKLEERVPDAWESALTELLAARVVMVIGAAEAGKTTFTAWLANQWQARGERVGLVDADVGQSEIGPPATVGLGAVGAPLTRSGDAEVIAFEFVGVTSPGKRPWQVADATGRLVTLARSRFPHVIVDTSGFVAGGFAAAVKQRKIAAVDPDLVILIQTADECEHLVRGLGARDRPRVVRLPAVRGGRRRSVVVRRQHRDAALARYFAEATPVTLDAGRVALHSVAGAPVALDAVMPGTLVALRDAEDRTLGLGVILAADAARGTLLVKTSAAHGDIARVTLGETTVAA